MNLALLPLFPLATLLLNTALPAGADRPPAPAPETRRLARLAEAAARSGQCLEGPMGEEACFLGGWFRNGLRLPEAPAAGPYEAVYLTATQARPTGAISTVTVIHERWTPRGEQTALAQTLVPLFPPSGPVHQEMMFAGRRLLESTTREATPDERQAALARALALDDEPAPCLPPGLPPQVLFWPVVDAQTIRIPGDTGQRQGVAVRYQTLDRAVVVVWVNGRLSLADDDPDGPTPPWIRDGAAMGPAPACRWRRVPATSDDDLET